MINFFHKKVNPVNPTNFVKGFLHESADSLVQVFHKSNHHILAKFYEYALYDRSAETIPAMVALLDFEMQPTTEKRDFIMLGLTQSPWKQTDCATLGASS